MSTRSSRIITTRASAVSLAILFLPVAAFAQGTVGSLTGTIQDTTGAVIPATSVTASNMATGIEYSAQSNEVGQYTINSVPPGDYLVAATADGFKTATAMGIRVNADVSVTQSFTLEVGAVTETVEVSADALQVQTTSGEVDGTVQVEQVLELPNPTRNVYALVNLVPGAQLGENSGRVSIGGGRTVSALAMLDGVQNSRGGLAVQNVEMSPPIDSMQEFNVKVNAMGAEYGRTSAGVISAVTKSGTNNFNGVVYEFIRNDKLDAQGWNNPGKPKLRRNTFGGALGGPIVRNRTFFFFNADIIKQRSAITRLRNVGLPEFQSGDFSNATGRIGGQRQIAQIFDPMSGSGSFTRPRATTQFPNNIIPRTRLDRVATAVLRENPIPPANRTPNNSFNNAGNWQQNIPNELDRTYYTWKVDHRFSDKLNMFGRAILTQPDQDPRHGSPDYGNADPHFLFRRTLRKNLAFTANYIFSPDFFLKLTAGTARTTVRRWGAGFDAKKNWAEQFGLPELARVAGEVFPRLNFQGGLVPITQIGSVGLANRIAAFNNFDWVADFTKIKGSHTLKFGYKHSRFQGNELRRSEPGGTFSFNGRWTQMYRENGSRVGQTGIRFADFMLGRLNSVSSFISPTIGKRIQYHGLYLQDDWKVNSDLTLNIGFRYEAETPITEVGDRLNGFCLECPSPLAGQNGIPEGAFGITTFPNRNGTGKYLWRFDKNNFAPRFGFAYRVGGSDKLVLRGGYGIFFGNPYDRNAIQVARAGFDLVYRRNHPVPFQLQDGLPAGALDDIPVSELTPNFGARGTRFANSRVEFFGEERETPYSHNMNLNLQTQWKDWFFEFGVLGNLGRQIAFPDINLNRIRPEDLPRLDPDHPNAATELQLRPYQTLASSRQDVRIMAPNWGISNAWLGTFKAERRFADGFGLTLAYTHTQWIDNIRFTGGVDVGDNDQIQNVYDFASERSSATSRIPHRVVLAPIYDLPFGRGRKFGSGWHPMLDAVAGGWQVSTIGTLRTGAPFGLSVQNGTRDNLRDNAPGSTLRPDYAQGVSGVDALYHPRKGQPREDGFGVYWLNEAAFARPGLYQFGNTSRTLPGVRSPALYNFEFMLAKNFQFMDRFRAQFRWEMFNAFNTPQLLLPNQSFGSGDFGIVTQARGRRIMQLGLKLYF